MREFVFPDSSLASRAGQFVWLEINTEDDVNAAFLETHPVDAWPTFMIVNPKDGSVALRWVGSLTVDQLQALLDNARIAVAGGGGAAPAADAALASADALYGDRKFAEAAQAYRTALGSAPDRWPPYARAVESLLFCDLKRDAKAECAVLARSALPRLAGTPSELNVAASGLDCALALPDDAPARAASVADFEAEVRRRLAPPPPRVAADDVSGAYGLLVEARRAAKDDEGARKTAGEWAAYLEVEAAKARTPGQRTVFDSHRLSAYLEMGEPARAVPMLEASERDFPDDYNPPARLALAYQALKQWTPALAASDRALARVYGPRKLRVLGDRAEIQVGSGDSAAARRTLEDAIAYAEGLPAGQRSAGVIARLKKKLETLPPVPAPSPSG